MRYIASLLLLFTCLETMSQELPLREIPPAPEAFTEGSIIARFTEGLGFRYYWATDGLRPEDLDYRPSEGARSSRETIVHIFGLTRFIYDTVMGDTIRVSGEYQQYDVVRLRRETLEMLQRASQHLRNGEFTPHTIKFPPDSEGKVNELPFWNLLNGPISDALYHTGQLVAFRRSSGNPVNPNISVFTGTVRQ